MPWWRKLFASLSLQRSRVNTGIIHVGFLVEQEVLGVVFFLLELELSLASIILQMFHTHSIIYH